MRSKQGRPTVAQGPIPLKAGEVEKCLVTRGVEIHRNNFLLKAPIGVIDFFATFARLIGRLMLSPVLSKRSVRTPWGSSSPWRLGPPPLRQ